MKFAIDRYVPGVEKEVCADDFYGKYIPRKYDRFFCPECGLQVYWVSKGGNQPNKFKHPKKTDTSPECDKRVDGRSELYLYERVGLPVYLSHLAGNSFQLAISFPAVGSKILDYAAAQNAKVVIHGNGTSRTVPINSNNFYSDSATLIPVNFLPQDNGRFRVEVSPASSYNKKWSDYAEGFTNVGAIFSYDESGGKKIHRDDSIFPGRQYYVVAREFSCVYNEVNYKVVGTLKLLNSNYQVYCMTVNISIQNEQRYLQISNFLRNEFGVGLLETAPEIIPLWPPVIERDVLVPTKDSSIYCAVTSGNDMPSVYSYMGNQVTNVPIYTDPSGEKHIFVKASAVDTVLSVDRKYVGREIVFKAKELPPSTSKYSFGICSPQGKLIVPEDMTDSVLIQGGILESNAKFDFYLGSVDHSFLHIPVRANETQLPTFSNLKVLLVAVEGGALYSQFVCTAHLKSQGKTIILNDFLQQCHGEYIPIPRWVSVLLSDLTRNGLGSVAQTIVGHIKNGKLPAGAVRSLYNIYRMNGGA